MMKTVLLAIEFAAIFIGLPTLWVLGIRPLPVIPALLLLTVGCVFVLIADSDFDRRQLWRAGALRATMGRVLRIFIVAAALIGLITWLFEPERLFDLIRRNPSLWIVIMVLYPLFSVYPQEVVYRTFLFHRYRSLFREPQTMILASAVAFGYVHVLFENVLAVAMSFVGGLLFAWTYHRTRSTLAVWVEHALYGCFIFTIGLGWYFYAGAAR